VPPEISGLLNETYLFNVETKQLVLAIRNILVDSYIIDEFKKDKRSNVLAKV
jgi:hypothetical protein